MAIARAFAQCFLAARSGKTASVDPGAGFERAAGRGCALPPNADSDSFKNRRYFAFRFNDFGTASVEQTLRNVASSVN
jgi:hypothetical protein